MPSITLIKGSDGTGNAAAPIIQAVRSPLAPTIIVNTVAKLPSSFMGTMGTPHTFVDPVTSEEITVISEATAVDFTGHVDGTNIEIDAIAPGYTDLGNAVGDIIVIKPTTDWANNLADVLAVAHSDSGAITTDTIAEKTAAAGVTVDGMKIKDSYVVGSATSGINNASLSTAAGELGSAWTAWTPTFTNSGGSCTVNLTYAKWRRVGKIIHWAVQCNVTAASAPGTLSFTVPVNSATANQAAGGGREDSATGKFAVALFKGSATAISVYFYDNTGSACTVGYMHITGGQYEGV